MRFLLVAALCGLALAAVKHDKKTSDVRSKSDDYSWDSSEFERRDVSENIFRADREYRYRFDGQLSAGIPLDIVDQHAITRIQALVTIQPKDERTFYMQMERVRFGQSQQQEMEPRYLKPFEAFETVKMDQEHERLLSLPLRFTYRNGMVSEIVFSENEQMWSENIKRAVLNMLQVDILKQNRVESEKRERDELVNTDNKEESWTGVERTLEGECQVSYIRVETEKGVQFTKSLNFTNCQERAESRHYVAMCEECESHNKEEKLSSSVMTMNMTGNHETYLINDVEIRSQHLFVSISDKHKLLGSFTHNRLRLVYAGKKEKSIPEVRGEHKKTLLYDNKWERMMEKFAQTGEEKYLVKIVKNKVEHIVKLIDQLAGHMVKNIEHQAPHTLARIVKLLRICTEEELRQVDKYIVEKVSSMEPKTSEKVRSVYYSALGLAGTRNTVKNIYEKINKGHMEPITAAKVLKSLIEMRYPSPQIVDEIQRICESDASYRSPVLRQSCWLTYGAVINDICNQEDSSRIRANRDERMCTRDMKKSYTSKILNQMRKASTRYEKVLFMKTLANAGLDTSIVELEKIIYDKSETKTIRLQAIEATRRLIPVMPRKIQRLLMPIYRNRFEKVELRLSALHHIMQTEPELDVLSQIADQWEQERSQQVRAFTYSCLKTWSESSNPCKESFSDIVSRMLKRMEKINIRPLDSRYAKWDWYSRDYESGWSANWAALFTNDSVLPNDVIAGLDGLFAGHFAKNLFQVGFSQHNMDSLITKLFNKIEENGLNEVIVRGKRAASESSFKPIEMLSNLYERLKISRRGVNPSSAHGLLYIRHRDVDYAVVPFEQESLPEFIRNMFHNGRVEIAELERWIAQGGHFTWSTAAYVYESTRRVPTALGIPVEMSIKMPTIATVSGQVKMEIEPKNGEKVDGLRLKVVARPSVASTHVTKIESFCPVVSVGTKILSNTNMNAPINTEILVKWNNKVTIKTVTKMPEEREHIGHFSTRPVTFVRHIRPEMRNYPEPIEKTIVIPEYQLPSHEVDREYFKMTGVALQVSGTLRRPLFSADVQTPKALLIADNHLEIVLVPTSKSPKELSTITEIELFQPAEQFESPKFDKYFEKTNVRNEEDLFETESGEYEDEDEKVRRSSFSDYLKSYKANWAGKAYKHRVFTRVETEQKDQFAEFQLIAQCDDKMRYCNAKVDAKRSPLMNDERREWSLLGKVELLYPQTPKSLKEMKEQQHRELQINGRFEWGSEKKQWMNLRVQGEQSREQKKWMKAVELKQTRLSELERLEEASRLNQYKMIVDYEMSHETRYIWDKVFTLIKGLQYYSPLSSEYEIVNNQQGQVMARLTIEPRGRRYVNLTIETPKERLSVSNVRMPFQLPTTKIYEKRSERSLFESGRLNPLVERITKQEECVIKTNKVNTFDDVIYRAPLTTCWTVLAKDCSSEKPAFAILMKKITKVGSEKKLKVATHRNVIVAELDLSNKDMKITVDGKKIDRPEELEKYDIVREETDVIRVDNDDFTVVFDGYEVRIKINSMYKNKQCGLCGHFDGERESEFRRADKFDSEEYDLPKFVKSYVSQDEECQFDEEHMNDEKNYEVLDSSYANKKRGQSWRQKWEVSSSEEEYEPRRTQSNEWDDESDESNNDTPVKRTRIVERSNKICFSMEPVEECENKSDETDMKKRTVEFMCTRRDNSQIRQLTRQARRSHVTRQQLEKVTPDMQTISMEIRYPTKCYAGRQ